MFEIQDGPKIRVQYSHGVLQEQEPVEVLITGPDSGDLVAARFVDDYVTFGGLTDRAETVV